MYGNMASEIIVLLAGVPPTAQATALAEQLGAAVAERDQLLEAVREKEGELMQADGKMAVLRNEVYRLQNMDGMSWG